MTLLSFLHATLKAVLYTILYLAGRRSAETEVEAKANAQALEEANKAIEKREKTRAEFDALKKRLPDSWDELDRVRKTNSR